MTTTPTPSLDEICESALAAFEPPVRERARQFVERSAASANLTRNAVREVGPDHPSSDELTRLRDFLGEVYGAAEHAIALIATRTGNTFDMRRVQYIPGFRTNPSYLILQRFLALDAPYAHLLSRPALALTNLEVLVRELATLLRRGGAINTSHCLEYQTTPCVLKARTPHSPEIDFGPFIIRVRPEDLGQAMQTRGDPGSAENYFRAIPVRPHPRTGDRGNPHPHVNSGGGMCLGDGRARVGQLLKAGYIDEAITVIDTVLHSYGSSPFRRIESYYEEGQEPTYCVQCRNAIDTDEDSEQEYHEALEGGYLCENCGFWDEVREGWSSNRSFQCPECRRTTSVALRVERGGRGLCRDCASRVPADPPPQPARPRTFTCLACGSTDATQQLQDAIISVNCCDRCSFRIHDVVISRTVLRQPGMFGAWVVMRLQNMIGHERALRLSLRPSAFTEIDEPARQSILAILLGNVGPFREIVEARGEDAALRRVVERLNSIVGHTLFMASDEACDEHDALFAARILNFER